VRDKGADQSILVSNYEFLTPQQEKMMATQPDMIVQFAHYLEEVYKLKGMSDPVVTADVLVTLNGQPARTFIDPHIDLTKVENNWKNKDWILEYE
jgi:hypothetical protein